jgi:NTE family protein
LGAGGFLGAAWMVGALASLQQNTGWDPREADLLVGTSAGSVLGALLRAGVAVDDLYDAHCGEVVTAELADLPDRPPGPALPGWHVDLTEEPCWPGLPRFGLGSVPLAVRAARNPLRFPPSAVCAALLPRGRRRLTKIGQLVEAANTSSRWPDHTWIVAMNYHTGARVAFGRPGSPTASLAEAVMASCAVPGWYAPVRIGRTPYVDGGVCSACNADLLARADLDEVYVLAPLASMRLDHPRGPLAWLERACRRAVTRRLSREIERLRAGGATVTVLAPDATDLAAMGANMMNAARQVTVMRTARDSVSALLAAPSEPHASLVGGPPHAGAAGLRDTA